MSSAVSDSVDRANGRGEPSGRTVTPDTNTRRITLVDIEVARAARDREAYPRDPLLDAEVTTERYIDPGYFEIEKLRVFRRTWQIGPHLSKLGEPDSYLVHEVPGTSYLFTRDRQGVCRGFINTCRHRGCTLVQGTGKSSRLVCPYHAWTYDLQGRLLGVPEQSMYQNLDKSTHGLHPLRVEEWGGFAWFNPQPDAMPLREYLGEVYDHQDPFPWRRFSLQHQHSHTIEANWKIALDNFIEMYHVPFTHKDSAAPHVNWRKSVVQALGRHSRFFFENASSAPTHRQLSSAGKTASERLYSEMDPATKELGYTYHLFPNAVIFPWADYLLVARFHGLSADRSRVDFEHYGLPPESPEEERSLQARVDFNAVVLKEDFGLLPRLQEGLKSGGITTMPLGYLELAMANFHRALDEYMREA